MTVLGIGVVSGALADRIFVIKPLDSIVSRKLPVTATSQKVLTEESVVIDVAEKSSPSVVTVSVTQQRQAQQFFDPFGMFGGSRLFQQQEPAQEVKQDIGTGFVVDGEQGLIVTNKHVVSDSSGKYRIITKDNKEFEVQKIYRDPANDLAILKIDAKLPALELGNSDNIKVGQFVVAIGTALGEFRHTVTTGVVSGLGRGIQAGDVFGGSIEQLDNVIQTDAAINPGNSGGPLINSVGQVIGINVAVAQGSQNIGFALPINVVKASLDNFNTTGQFNRPFLGVRYRMIPKETALMNDMPEGAYIAEVVEGSPAAEAGLKQGDVIVRMNDQSVKDNAGGLSAIINTLKVGDKITIEIYRDGKTETVTATMKVSE
jgi:S1-C subfamily serine protease